MRVTSDVRKQSTWCDLTVGHKRNSEHSVSARGALRHGLHCSWQSTSVRDCAGGLLYEYEEFPGGKNVGQM